LEVAVLMSALANGGTVLKPRLVAHIEAQDPLTGGTPRLFPDSVVLDHLGVSARSMQILHQAMLADTEDPEGSGRAAAVPGLHICAKTGTAQVQNTSGHTTHDITWFGSFANYNDPHYAVVVMIEHGASGGTTCAPIGGKIYEAIKRELIDAPKTGATLAAKNQP
jgi:cell division protein FtsI/penicillin-binding protein 2